jgi:hypothetical protein
LKYLYASILFLLIACSKDNNNNNINECGLVGIWLCCEPMNHCTITLGGQTITEKWTFEADGDYFIDDFTPSNGKWNTDGDCTELVFEPGSVDESKLKIDISGDELVMHKGGVIGDKTFCRQ